MNELRKLIILIVVFGVHTACSTKTVEKDAVNVNTNSPAETVAANNGLSLNENKLKPGYNSETKDVGEGFKVPANANIVVVNTEQPKETIKNMPAPDDSTYSAEMNSKGQPVETRIFKSHPVLAKIEKITMSPRDYIYKIYLKNGKVIESKSPDLKDFRVIAPVNILDAINIKPPPPKPARNSANPDQQKKPVLIPKANL
ncbi:MAG: hypothetical protein ABIP06_02605 [Pyrinomonadaceae bacterium]